MQSPNNLPTMNRLFHTIVLSLAHLSFIIAQTNEVSSHSYHLVKSADSVDDGVYLIGGYQKQYLYLMNTIKMDPKIGKMRNPMEISGSLPDTLILTDNDFKDYPSSKLEFEIKKKDNGYVIMQGGKYLCATSTETLSFEDTYKENGIWSIKDQETMDLYRLVLSVRDERYLFFRPRNSNTYPYFFVSDRNSLAVNLYRKDHTINIGNTHFATYYNGKWDSKVPEGVTAYTFIINDTGQDIKLNKTHEYKSGDIIPAGSPVILYSEGENDYVMELSSPNNSLPKYENALKGTDSDYLVTTSESQTYYILSLNENNETNSIGFYPIENFTNTAHKAYLPVNKTSESKPLYVSLDFINNNTSKVNTHPYEHKDYNKTYNVTGKLCNPHHHGITIRNGKKYIK